MTYAVFITTLLASLIAPRVRPGCVEDITRVTEGVSRPEEGKTRYGRTEMREDTGRKRIVIGFNSQWSMLIARPGELHTEVL